MPSQHALLSASSSERWLHCTPSARLEERIDEKPSVFAAEGTVAHSKAEEKLTNWNTGHSRKKVKCDSGEMDEATTNYKDYVVEIVNKEKKKHPDTKLFVEVQLDLTPWIPEGFGTADAVVVNNETLHVIDLKYGKGLQVNAPDNSQLMLYAAGAKNEFELFYDFKDVVIHIFQPRLDHISTETYTVEYLEQWLEFEVVPRAKEAYEGKGKQVAGKWCRFCKVKGNCKARALYVKAIEEKYQELDAMLLSDDEIADILPKLDQMSSWISDIREFALDQALEGTTYRGYKLVEGISRRKITDETKASEKLQEAGYSAEAIMTKPKLQSITTLEKLIGKKEFAELVGDLVQKPEGKPTLVPETDKRPEYRSGLEEFKDE